MALALADYPFTAKIRGIRIGCGCEEIAKVTHKVIISTGRIRSWPDQLLVRTIIISFRYVKTASQAWR